MQWGYLHPPRIASFGRLRAGAVVRAKSNLKFRHLYPHRIDRSTGLICDQTIVLITPRSTAEHPGKLRRVHFRDDTKGEARTYLTNGFDLLALTVADFYRSRWQ